MKIKTKNRIILLILIIIFGLFIIINENNVKVRNNDELTKHISVIEDYVWNLNHEDAAKYLEGISKYSKYEEIKIFLINKKEPFINITAYKRTFIDNFLFNMGLIKRKTIFKDLYRQNKKIGKFNLMNLHTTIYTYLYAFVLFILLWLVARFFIQIVNVKSLLEIKVKDRTKELKEKEVYSKSLFEDSRIALVVMDLKTYKFIDINKAGVKIYGYKNKKEVIGLTPLDVSNPLQYNGEDSAEIAKIHIENAIKKGSVTFEWKHKKSDGTVWDAEVELMLININKEQLIQFCLIDITDRKKAEVEKIKLEKQLFQSRKMDAIGQLAGGVAHDFNNMLAGIFAASELLKSPKRNLDEKSLSFVDLIIDASERAADLTAKLLEFGRKGNQEKKALDVNKIIEDTISILTKTVDKKININFKLYSKNNIINGNNSSLQNIFLNIGINASHAMENGGDLIFETKNIELNETFCKESTFDILAGKYIQISIQDTGGGIKEEDIKKIFEPFFTTKIQGKGTGLGLASAYGSIQDHKGFITVYSELKVGTVFHIFFPILDKDEDISVIEDVDRSGTGNIFLVDDENIIRITGKAVLEDLGYNVTTFENGFDAIESYKELKDEIDLVITDMIMPKISGKELFYKLKEINKDCKIILSSGFSKDEDLKEMKRDGLLGFLPKPFQNVELSKLLLKVLK